MLPKEGRREYSQVFISADPEWLGVRISLAGLFQMAISKELAELLGAIAGDGSLIISKKKGDYKLEIYGNLTEDLEYFEYLSLLIQKIFKKSPKTYKRNDGLKMVLYSKQAVLFLKDKGIPSGQKARTIVLPNYVKQNTRLACNFLKGLADTDFSVAFKKAGRKKHSYPRITANMASKQLIEDVASILKKLGITYTIIKRLKKLRDKEFAQWEIDINGKENLKKWIEHIGFSNPKHLTKIKLWEKQGFYLPYTTLVQRQFQLSK